MIAGKEPDKGSMSEKYGIMTEYRMMEYRGMMEYG